MKFGIYGDLHVEHAVFNPKHVPTGVDVLVNAGDTHPYPGVRREWTETVNHPCHVEVLGNHDYYGQYMPMPGEGQRLHHVRGITIAACTLWTKLKPTDWDDFELNMADSRYIGGIDFASYEACHRSDLAFLERSNADVFVTHHSPSPRGAVRFAGNRLNHFFHNNLEHFVLELENPPLLWIHGHSHEPADYMIGRTRVFSNPRGYPGEAPHKNYSVAVLDVDIPTKT